MLALECISKGIALVDKDGNPRYTVPSILRAYIFCSPALDGNFRCLPRQGGYMDQLYVDMIFFDVIEQKVFDLLRRKQEAIENANKQRS